MHQAFVIFAMGVLCVLAGIQGRSVSMLGDIAIDITDTKFVCDKIECPADTSRCVVTKEKNPKNATVLERSNICYSSTNAVLKSLATNETIDANANVKVHIEANRNGLISMSNSYNSFVSKDFDEVKFDKEMTTIQENLNKDMENLNNEMSKIGQELSNMFQITV